MNYRVRRRLRVLGLHGLRLLRRHYVTLMSAIILAVTGALALTSTSFEIAKGNQEGTAQAATTLLPPSPAPQDSRASPALPVRQRRLVIVYLVEDDDQKRKASDTFGGLIWDNHLETGGQDRVIDRQYVLAGTPEAESTAIRLLNYYLEIAAARQFDLRVVDLRSNRASAANTASP